jgi:general secretion pathway protein H
MRRTFAQVNADDGYTLLEMIAVLAILAITAAVAVPQFSGTIQHERLNQLGLRIARIMAAARTQARDQNGPADVVVDLRRRRIYAADDQTYTLPNEISVQVIAGRLGGNDLHGETIRFYSDGSASGGRITLSAAGETGNLDINWITGRTKWWRR